MAFGLRAVCRATAPVAAGLALMMTFPSAALPASNGVVINEIMYNSPYSPDQDSEWVELYNRTDQVIDLSLWTLRDDNDSHRFTFPNGTEIVAYGYLVICKHPDLFMEQYPLVIATGGFDFNFGDGGDTVRILDANEWPVDVVEYSDESPWVKAADGQGASLECVDPAGDNSVFSAWGASLEPYPCGTPGEVNTVYSPGSHDTDVIINEVMYHPTSRNPILYTEEHKQQIPDLKKSINPDLKEYIELYNRGSQQINLSGWKFTDGVLFTFPDSTTLDAGAFLVVCKDLQQFEASYMPVAKKVGPYEAFLDNGGEKVVLSDAKGVPIDFVHYDDAEPWPVGADGDGHSLELVNPYEDNNTPCNWRNSVENNPFNGLFPPDYPDADERYMNPDIPHGTPGFENSRSSLNNSPFITDVSHLPAAPTSSDSVVIRARISDGDGISFALVQYQVVQPGQYVSKFDPQFEFSSWPTMQMNDNGLDGDEVAGDGIYSVNLGDASHRELVRYRIVALDGGGRRAESPYPEDPVPNHAYFVYDGVPDYPAYYHNTGSDRGQNLRTHTNLRTIPVYHLIAKERETLEAQYRNFPFGSWPQLPERNRYRWLGTFVFENKVYDHVMYRVRGGTHRYDWPKRSWKIHFRKGHFFRGRDNDGNEFLKERDRIILNADQHNNGRPRGETGMYHTLAYYLFKKVNVAAPFTTFVHFRIIDAESEDGSNRSGIEQADRQYYGDFFGLFVELEPPGDVYLENNGRDPEGNLYNVKPESPPEGNRKYYKRTNLWSADYSDVLDFDRGYQGLLGDKRQYLIDHLDLNEYLSWRSVALWIGHYDQGEHNYYFYHNPATDRWEVYPWDLDNTFCSSVHGLSGESGLNWAAEYVWRNYNDFSDLVLLHQNRLRELVQSILNSDYTIPLVEKWAAYCGHVADADEDRWDWYPMPVIPGEPWPSGWLTQTGTGGTSAQQGQYRSHAVRMQQLKDWISARSNSSDLRNLPIGYNDPNVPATPVNVSPQSGSLVSGQVVLGSSAFSDPNGDSHEASRWIVILQGGDWVSPLWDSDDDANNKTFIGVPYEAFRSFQTYIWRVKHKDSTGRWSYWSAPTPFTVQFVHDDTAPTMPQSLTAEAPDFRTVVLSWSASYDPESGVVGYELYRDGQLLAASLTQLTYMDGVVVENMPYTYRVVAVNGAGLKSVGAEVTITTPPDLAPPAVLSAEPSGDSRIIVTFDELLTPASAENPANYRVGGGISVLSAVLAPDGQTVELTTTPLTYGRTYALIVYDVCDRSSQQNPMSDGAALQFTPELELQLSGVALSTGSLFFVEPFAAGNFVYSDRSEYFIGEPVPDELSTGCLQILVPNSTADRGVSSDNYVTFESNLPVETWVGYRTANPLPSWLDPALSDWEAAGFTQLVNKSDATTRYHDYYRKAFPAGSVAVGGNANSSLSSYILVVRPLIPPGPDADGDCLPDQWEVDRLGSTAPLPEEDPDGDGQSNFVEFVAGTAPLDSSSFFAVVNIVSQSDEVTITWQTSPHRYYQVYCASSVLGPWVRLGAALDATSGALADNSYGIQQRFYRVETW